MALFRKIFYRKPPEGLLEISERVYVFDFCFSKNLLEGNEYEAYIGRVVDQLHDYFPDASFIVFSFGDAAQHKQITNVLSEYNITLIDYPSHYENCPLLTVEMIHHFLRSSESWLCIGQKNVILMQCHKGAFPLLAFMLASFLIYRKQYTGEKRTLDMVYRQASQELLHSSSSLNPLPSQLRYLQYVSRRNIGSRWPPLDRALTLDCVILRAIPYMDGRGGCRPIFRVYGPDPLMAADRKPKLLFSMPKKSRGVGYFKQAESELVKIDINCHVQGDVVIECFTLDDNLEHEQIMFRVMFNTAFIRSNVLVLNCEEIDTMWNVTDQFPKDFLAEVIFSDMDSSSSLVVPDFTGVEDIEGLPIEAFATIQEMFNNLDWGDPEREIARNIIQQITVSSILEEKHELTSFSSARIENSPQSGCFEARPTVVEGLKSEEVENESSSPSAASKSSLDSEYTTKKIESSELHVSVQRPAQSKIISARIHQTSPPNHSSLSSSSQGSPIALSRYHSAPSAVGITALLHDSEFSDKEVSGALNPESSISPSAPSVLQPLQPTNSSVSQPEKHRKHHVDSKSGSGAPPPPPPPPPPMSLSTCLLIQKPQIRQQSPPSASLVPPPPPPPPLLSSPSPTPSLAHILSGPLNAVPPAYPPPPPPLPLVTSESQSLSSVPSPPPPSPLSSNGSIVQNSSKVIHPSPTPSSEASPTIAQDSSKKSTVPASLPPPQRADSATVSLSTCSVPPPPPPCPPGLAQKEVPDRIPQVVPPPPAPLLNASSKAGNAYSNLHSSASTLLGGKGKMQLRGNTRIQSQSKKTSLKPYHWLKLTRAMQGSLWAEAQKPEEAAKAPELDLSELESLFSANVPNSDHGGSSGKTNRGGSGLKSDKVHLIELRRAYNCEIMLTKVKIPLSDLMNLVLALDDSALDIDQVDNLIKFCPTKEEIELLKNYKGDKENLGKCEQFFLELMKVPRVESKLRVFSFKIQFCSQVSDLRTSLNVINSASDEVRNSVKLKRIMQTILSLGNALNHGTARGSAVGFRLDSLPKLAETRARNNKLTLIHYLCKVLASKLPEVLDFHEDLVSLEAATKIQLKYLAEEMQAISKGIEKVIQELAASENDGAVSENFCKTLKDFLGSAEAQVRSLASLYSGVGRNADALALYFGEDPARCPFEQVVSTLLSFVRMFKRAHEENCKQLEFEKKKKAQEEAEIAKAKPNSTSKNELAADSIMEAIFKKTNTDLGH